MLDSDHIHDLPIRQRSLRNEAEQDQDIEFSSDDDLEHISRPGSVRSLNTPSPSSSPLLVPALEEEHTAVSSLNLQIDTQSQNPHTSRGCQAAHDPPTNETSSPPTDVSQRTTTQAQNTSPSCHNHASIDQKIIDQLIQHTLTLRLEQEHGHGSSKDQKLRQKMMSRFRGLPAEHSFVKNSVSQVDGSKALFQGQQRSHEELQHIYRLVFTDVERMALNFVMECHVRHFRAACTFSDAVIPSDRRQLYQAMLQPGNKDAKRLARQIQTKILESLDKESSHRELFDNLRWQTKLRIRTPYSLRFHEKPCEPIKPMNSEGDADSDWKVRIASDPQHQLANMRCIFYETMCNLPNERYSPNDNCNYPICMIPTSVKREPPEDDVESGPCLSPPLKKFQPDRRGWQVSKSEIISVPAAPRLANRSLPTKDWSIDSTASQQSSQPVGCRRRINTNPEGDRALRAYQMQLVLLEQQKRKEKQLDSLAEAEKNASTHHAASRSDESETKQAADERPQDNVGNLLQGSTTRVGRRAAQLRSSSPEIGFSAQSRNVFAGVGVPPREYRQDTLLAQSTQLPISSASCTNDKPRSGGSDLPYVDNELEHEAVGAAVSETRTAYSFAPAHQPDEDDERITKWKARLKFLERDSERHRALAKQNHPMSDFQLQLMLLEQQGIRRCIQAKLKVVLPSDSLDSKLSTDRQEAPPIQPARESIKPGISSNELAADYQKQLELLEQQNKLRMQLKERQQRSRGDILMATSSEDASSQSPPVSSQANVQELTKPPDYGRQLQMLEEDNRKRLMLAREEQQQQRLEGSRAAHGGERNLRGHLASTRKYGLGAVTLEEYQRKLMEREREEMRLIRQKQDEQRRRSAENSSKAASSGTQSDQGRVSSGGHYPPPKVVRY